MDFNIETSGIGGRMTFDKAETVMNNIFLSLMIPRGGWTFNPAFGSRLHLLQRSKNTEKTAALAREYCLEALQWLLDLKRVSKIDVYTERDRQVDLNRLKVLVEATQVNGLQVNFQTFVEVV